MHRLIWTAILILGLAAPARAADDAPGPVLRRWHFGLQGVSTWRDRYDVFDRGELPPGAVEEPGRGGGVIFGYRFGGRFLLGLQVVVATHAIIDKPDKISDVEALITGTVLFRQTATLQPFLRGGFGGGGEFLDMVPDVDRVFAYGTSAIAGGGMQVRLSSRFSLDLEAVATFTNFLEVAGESSDTWQVRESNWGWRLGVGAFVWF